MKPPISVVFQWFALGIAILARVVLLSAQENSHARVVRLSFTEGTVTVQRPDVAEWAKAPVNTPLQEGFKLSTAENSYAEVEFENASSTVRVGQLSLIEFTQLELAPSGAKINRLKFDQGYATFHFVPQSGDVYEVKVGDDVTLTPTGSSEFRTDVDDGQLRVEVFKGSVDVSAPGGSQTLTKNAVLQFHMGSKESFEIAQGITKDAWDDWVADRDNLQVTAHAPVAPRSYSADVGSDFYGWNDLSYYGDWSMVPGYGYGWFPDVAWGWSPYSLGRWCWYPGFGNTWISAEPWGWLPFHYGGWAFDPVFGWFWMPGFGAWSPGLVTWYQGPGWIGWAPQRATPQGTTQAAGGVGAVAQNCAPGRTCMTIVRREAFEKGAFVTPNDLAAMKLSHAEAARIAAPEVPPTRQMMLPGSAVPEAAALMSSRTGVRTIGATAAPTRAFVGSAPVSTRMTGGLDIRNAFRGEESAPRHGFFGFHSHSQAPQSGGGWGSRSSSRSSGGAVSRGESGGVSRGGGSVSHGGGGFGGGGSSVGSSSNGGGSVGGGSHGGGGGTHH